MNKMCRTQCVLAVVALHVGLAYFWDLAVSSGDQLTFYKYNGLELDKVQFKSQNLGPLAYDPVHNMMLYVDKQNNNDTICGYVLSSKENGCFIQGSGRNILSIAYDPPTDQLFFTDANEKSVNSISFKGESKSNIDVNLLIKMYDRTPEDIAVDSCRGYIYWSKIGHMDNIDVEKARFDGSGREVLFDQYPNLDVISLTIDPQTKYIYYLDFGHFFFNSFMASVDSNGTNIDCFFRKNESVAKELTVSKDYFYFMTTTRGLRHKSVWRFPKNTYDFENAVEISKFYTNGTLGIAANYKIEDQINGVQDCDPLSNLIATTEAPGNTDERNDVCENCTQSEIDAGNTGDQERSQIIPYP